MKTMRSASVLWLLLAAALFGQTVETIPLRAVLSSANESQQPASLTTGAATIWLHVVRDSSGKVTSGSADAVVSYNFSSAGTATAMHIHQGAAGVDGSIVVPFALTRTDVTGVGTFPATQTAFPSSAVTLDTINGILADPTQYYFNVHSTDAPAGVMRGQLARAEMIVRMGLMRPENETPPIAGTPWKGVGVFQMLVTRNARNTVNSAYAIFDVAYSGFPSGTNFTGLHIHAGAAQVAGPVVINSGLRGQVPADTTGAGSLHYESEVDINVASALDAVNGVIANPSGYYINAHTSDFPNGAIRSQLRNTDRMDFQVTMSPANETPPITGLNAQTPAKVSIFTTRNNADSSVAGGFVVFDTNPAFPTAVTFTGLHIHRAPAGTAGPIVIDPRFNSAPLLVTNGNGNITRTATVVDDTALATLTALVNNPSGFYVNLHTSDNPGGATRAQLTQATTALPTITSVQLNATGTSLTTLAPGANFVINGTNLAGVGTDITGFTNLLNLPTSLNGVSVTIGGSPVPLSSVGPGQIAGQVPFNVSSGTQSVIVTNPNGSSTSFQVRVASAAPAILYGPQGVVATRRSDGAAITQSNAAAAGDVIVVTAVGLGQTAPSLSAGSLVGTTQPFTVSTDVSARIGGVNTTVLTATATPGLVGTYQVAIVVPAGVAAGNAPLLLQQGLVTSNVVAVPVK